MTTSRCDRTPRSLWVVNPLFRGTPMEPLVLQSSRLSWLKRSEVLRHNSIHSHFKRKTQNSFRTTEVRPSGKIPNLGGELFPDFDRADCVFLDLPSNLPDTFPSDPIPRSLGRGRAQHSQISTRADAAETHASSWAHAPETRATVEARYPICGLRNSVPEVEKGLMVIWQTFS
jgi:hypothetical protein